MWNISEKSVLFTVILTNILAAFWFWVSLVILAFVSWAATAVFSWDLFDSSNLTGVSVLTHILDVWFSTARDTDTVTDLFLASSTAAEFDWLVSFNLTAFTSGEAVIDLVSTVDLVVALTVTSSFPAATAIDFGSADVPAVVDTSTSTVTWADVAESSLFGWVFSVTGRAGEFLPLDVLFAVDAFTGLAFIRHMIDWSVDCISLAVVVAFVSATVALTVPFILASVSWAATTVGSIVGLDVDSLVAFLWFAISDSWLSVASNTGAGTDLFLASSATTVFPVFKGMFHVTSTGLAVVIVKIIAFDVVIVALTIASSHEAAAVIRFSNGHMPHVVFSPTVFTFTSTSTGMVFSFSPGGVLVVTSGTLNSFEDKVLIAGFADSRQALISGVWDLSVKVVALAVVMTFVIAAVSAIVVIIFAIPPVAAAVVISVDNADEPSGLTFFLLTVLVNVWFSWASGGLAITDLFITSQTVLNDRDPPFRLITKTAEAVVDVALPGLAFAIASSGRATFTSVSFLDPLTVVFLTVSRVLTSTSALMLSESGSIIIVLTLSSIASFTGPSNTRDATVADTGLAFVGDVIDWFTDLVFLVVVFADVFTDAVGAFRRVGGRPAASLAFVVFARAVNSSVFAGSEGFIASNFITDAFASTASGWISFTVLDEFLIAVSGLSLALAGGSLWLAFIPVLPASSLLSFEISGDRWKLDKLTAWFVTFELNSLVVILDLIAVTAITESLTSVLNAHTDRPGHFSWLVFEDNVKILDGQNDLRGTDVLESGGTESVIRIVDQVVFNAVDFSLKIFINDKLTGLSLDNKVADLSLIFTNDWQDIDVDFKVVTTSVFSQVPFTDGSVLEFERVLVKSGNGHEVVDGTGTEAVASPSITALRTDRASWDLDWITAISASWFLNIWTLLPWTTVDLKGVETSALPTRISLVWEFSVNLFKFTVV